MDLKTLDIILILFFSTVVALLTFIFLTGNKNNSFVKVEVVGDSYIYELGMDREISVDGLIGESIIKIEGNSVAIIDSPCKNRTCIHIGKISRVNQSSACLPNRVIITIDGVIDEIDSISY